MASAARIPSRTIVSAAAYAAALTMVLLALLAALAIGQFLFFERRVHYQ